MPDYTTKGLRRLSSCQTFWYKKIFPVMWFGFLLIFVAILAASLINGGQNKPPVFLLVVPFIMMAFGAFLMSKLIFTLMDNVYDAGDSLIIVNKDIEERISLANIINVSHTQLINPRRVTLMLRQPCRFGDRVAFCPALATSDVKSLGFTNAIADELVRRIDALRQEGQPTRA